MEQLVPKVLDDLKDVIRMTEAATIRVLDETEALVHDGHAAARLLADARHASAVSIEAVAAPMRELQVLIERSNTRAMAIMCALEFQDVTSQKVHRTFGMLEDVLARLGKIRRLVDAGAERAHVAPAPPVAHEGSGASGQRLADELLLAFAGRAGG